ncbi:MAG TPA: fibronectin type III domain-containing protein, partial [Thermoplasmata archaeon]|nr:fibronectin type III domain-containing protein [Thermoplasmata archaeon]
DQLNLSAWGLSGASPSLLWRVSRAPLPACAWTPDPVFAVLVVTGCGGGPGSNEAVLFDASNGTARAVEGTGVDPVAITATSSGSLVVANFGSTILTVFTPGGGAAQLLPAPGLGFSGVAADPSGRVLFATSEFYDDLFFLNASTGVEILSVPTPSVDVSVAVDAVTGGVTATLETTGQLLLAPRVPAPSAPPGLSVHPGNTSLRVDWGASIAPSGFPVQNYSVWTSFSANFTTPTRRATTTGFEANLTGLVDGTGYYVSVEASGATGTGPLAAPVVAIPAGVPYPPTSVSAVGSGPSSITVRWAAPADDGGANLSGFVVSYAFDAIGPWVAVSAPGTSDQLVLGQLSPSTHYYIEVSAVNSVGTGNPSPPTTATTLASPSSASGTNWLPWEIAGVLVAAALGGVAVAYRLRRRKRTGPVR